MSSLSTIGRLVAIIAIIAVALVAIVPSLAPSHPGTTALPTTSSSIPVSTSYSTGQATAGSSSVSIDGTLAADCPSGQTNSSGFIYVAAGTSSLAVFCVQFYYYNSFQGYNGSAPLMLNVSSALTIQAVQEVLSDGLFYPQSFDGGPNFTVTASQSQLAIGGPTNENEGAMVAYAVTANSDASGTYQLGLFPSSGLSLWTLTPQAPESCGYYGELVAGNGLPNYAQNLGGCVTYSNSILSVSTGTEGSSYYALPGITYPLLIGNVYFSIIGVTNSTG